MPINPSSIVRTDRLTIRRLTAKDFESMFSIYSDAEAMKWCGDGEPISEEACHRWLDVTANNYERRGYGMSVVEHLQTGSVVGYCGLVHPGNQPQAEIKYAFARAHWHQGFATEAASAMLRYGADCHGIQEVIATIHADNIASQRVAKKIGMKHVESIPQDDGTTTEVFLWETR